MNLDPEHFLSVAPALSSGAPLGLRAAHAFIALLQDWQTLTAALIALLAAAWHARILQRQIRSAEYLEQLHRKRRFDAKRALLPVHLHEILANCRLWVHSLQSLYQATSTQPPGGKPFRASNLSHQTNLTEAFEWLESFVEVADDQACPFVIDLIRDLQVVQSRTARLLSVRSPHDASPLQYEIRSCIVDIASVYAACERLYGYARGGPLPEPGPPDKAAVVNALKALDFWKQLHPELFQHLEKVGVSLPSGRI